jgi:hypothetical protein
LSKRTHRDFLRLSISASSCGQKRDISEVIEEGLERDLALKEKAQEAAALRMLLDYGSTEEKQDALKELKRIIN